MFKTTTQLISLLVIVVTTSLALAIMGLVIPEFSDAAKQNQARALEEEAALRANMVDQAIESWLSGLNDLTADHEIQRACVNLPKREQGDDRAPLIHLLGSFRILRESPDFLLLDCFGRRIADSGDFDQRDFEQLPWIVRMLDGKRTGFTDLVRSPEGNGVLLAQPIRFRGSVEGILLARFSMNALERAIRLDEVASDRYVELVVDDEILARGGQPHDSQATTKPLSKLSAQLRVRMDESSLRAQMKRALLRLTASLLIVGGLVVLVGTIIGRRMIARPLREITSHARSMAVGRHLTTPIVSRSHIREVSELTISIKRMGETIQRRESELEATLNHLEERVVGRTRELEQESHRHRRTAEELRTEKDRAEAASRAKDDFLANMSHEIRTPMNGVVGMATDLSQTELTPDQRESVRIINRSADALLTVIDDILDFSKIEAGKLGIERLPTPIDDMIGDALHLLRPRAMESGLELIAVIGDKVPTNASLDPTRVRQVLLNLAGNALKFTKAGSVELHVSALDEAGWLRFEVRDSGIGISPAAQAKLFQPFVQADQSTTRVFGGTGLGLSICRRLVELMGGRIGVESQANEGSTFWFEIPAEAQPKVAGEFDLQGAPVLVFDPHPAVRKALAEAILFANGAPAVSASIEHAMAALSDSKQPWAGIIIPAECEDTDVLSACLHALGPDAPGTRILVQQGGSESSHQDLPISDHEIRLLPRPAVRGQILAKLDPRENRLRTRVEPEGTQKLGLHILVVEDNVVNRTVVERHLVRLGCTAVHAENGREALRMLDESGQLPDAVLMDCHMPVMDGYEATQRYRGQEAAGQHLPIIALTADGMAKSKDRCLDAGMDDFLVKPVKPEQLHRMLAIWAQAPVSKD